MTDQRWYDHSLIPPAYHVRPAGADRQHALHERQIRMQELTGGFSYQFPSLTSEAAAVAAGVERELLANRRDLGLALQLAVAPSTLPLAPPPPSTPVPSAVPGAGSIASHTSVLAFAAASVPLGSSVDPMPLGAQLLFPASRPNSRKQVGYLFMALEGMLREVGKETEKKRLAATAIVNAAQTSPQKASTTKRLLKDTPIELVVPPLVSDLATYASWCGLASLAATSSSSSSSSSSTPTPAPAGTPQLTSPVADLAIGSFLHTPTSSSSSSSGGGGGNDVRFQSSVDALHRLATHGNAVAKKDKSHQKLTTVMQELSVYLVGMHEVARQEWMHCQERGDLLHLLIQRCAVMVQALLPLAQREVVDTVAAFKKDVQRQYEEQMSSLHHERLEWAKLNTRSSATLIAVKDDLRAKNARVKVLEAEVERRRIECTETDRYQRENAELHEQLKALREQVAASTVWRAEQQLTLEQLHFTTKQAEERRQALEHEMDELKRHAATDKQRYEQNMLDLQTRFLELRIPDEVDPALKKEVHAMMEERAHEASSLKHSSESSHLLAAGTTSSPSRRRSIAAASNPDQILEGGSDSSDLSSRDDEDDEDEEEADRRSQGGSSKGSSAAPSMPTSTITSAATSRRSSHSVASHTKHARSATHTGMPTRVASMISGSDFAPPQPPPTDTELDPLTHEDADSDSGDSVASSVASTGGGEGAIGGGAVGGGSVRARPSSSRRSKPSAAFLALLRNTRVDYTLHEVDLYLMSQSARLYSMLLTKRQIARFRHWQATPEKKRGPIKLPGQIGPKDWLVNFCWSILKRRAESDAVTDCYQQPRQPFPEFFFQTLLMHDTVKGAKSVFLSVVWSVLRSLIRYKNTCSLASVMVDLLEETVPLDGLNFLMSLINAMANTSVGIDYGPGTYGAIKWVCTLRTRFVNRLAMQEYPDEALKALNESVDRHSVGMSLAEMKYHHQTLQQKKAAEQARQRAVGSNETAAGGAKDTLQVQHMKQLTKIDFGTYLKLAGKHYNLNMKQQVENVKAHFKTALDKAKKKSMAYTQFVVFARRLSPSLDTRHIQQLYSDAIQVAKTDGIRFKDFKAAGGLQLLSQDYARLVYHQSDWSVLQGEQQLVECIDLSWLRLRPIMQPLMELANTDRSLLSCVLSERLLRLSGRIESLRLSLLHHVASPRVRELVATYREVVHEVYAFLRYREEFGATVRVKNRYEHAADLTAPLGPDQPPPPTIFATAPGPNAAAMADELHALLFLIQRELLAFCPHEEVPHEDMVHAEQQEE